MANASNGDYYTSEFLPYFTIQLTPPTLSEIAEVLQNGMQPLFHDVKVDIARCPYLTTAPYNLAGIGLGGNTSVVEFVHDGIPWNYKTRNIQDVLTTSCRNSFIIGSTYATKPHMPYYGHLIMNATYRAPMDIRNESRLIFAERRNGQTRIEKLTDPNQMIYTNKGSFFVSEALGGVLKITNGIVACNLMWDDYEEPMLESFHDFIRRQQCPEIHLQSDMIAVGTIINDKLKFITAERRYDINLYDRNEFHCFSNYGSGGQFISDITPDTTEYEGYFNVAENMSVIPFT
ncbi:PREDICTED: ester hydrolase C11orf54 homolog [Acromyrmex echinatior]|uniref:ester hydrolase C11orf54 homolog n=1 Tax=Acromyrmex echinatior TaxID=103372 RepID=UPI0005810BC5|nr:PREDICTED: ester hydrolase C11orf54 homolog [Acromyrmex echinatior]